MQRFCVCHSRQSRIPPRPGFGLFGQLLGNAEVVGGRPLGANRIEPGRLQRESQLFSLPPPRLYQRTFVSSPGPTAVFSISMGASEPPLGPPKQVPLVWVGVDDLPVQFLNQFIGQADRNEIYLTLGQLVPPALLGSDESKRQQLEALDYVTVRPIVRLGFTPQRLEELIEVLEATKEIYEQLKQDE